MKRIIKDYIHKDNFVVVTQDTTVVEAIKNAAAEKTSGILIEDNGAIIGIFTENDLAFRVVGKGLDVTSTKMKDVMTKNPVCIDGNTDIDSCMFMMMRNKFRHLPIRDNQGKIVGVASVHDVLKAKVEEFQALNQASNIFESENLIDTSGVEPKEDVITKITKEYKA